MECVCEHGVPHVVHFEGPNFPDEHQEFNFGIIPFLYCGCLLTSEEATFDIYMSQDNPAMDPLTPVQHSGYVVDYSNISKYFIFF